MHISNGTLQWYKTGTVFKLKCIYATVSVVYESTYPARPTPFQFVETNGISPSKILGDISICISCSLIEM